MQFRIILDGNDLLRLIQDKIGQEVSKHGHPGSFEIQAFVLRDHDPKGTPLDESILREFKVVADAAPKEDQKGS